MAKWGDVLKEAVGHSAQPADMTMFDKNGKVLIQPPLPTEMGGFPILYSNRGMLQRLMLDYAKSLGIKIRFGTRIREYFEEEDHAGVVIDGERLIADGVVAADGIHSAARKHVIGIQQHPRTSGFAVYRTWFPLELLAENPLTKKFTETDKDTFHVWLGTDTHAIMFVSVAPKSVVIFCTHKVRLLGRQSSFLQLFMLTSKL